VTTGIDVILEVLNAHYTFEPRGRIAGARHDGVLPRFVLGRAAEGCIWRIRSDLPEEAVRDLARLAGREPGARFDGELPAPPERLMALCRVLAGGSAVEKAPDRELATRAGVVVGELWRFD
jgi:hypothetical protein